MLFHISVCIGCLGPVHLKSSDTKGLKRLRSNPFDTKSSVAPLCLGPHAATQDFSVDGALRAAFLGPRDRYSA